MSFLNGNTLTDRLQAANEAREAMRARFRDRHGADDPAVQAKIAERKAIAEAREARIQEREAQRKAEAEREVERKAAERQAEIERKAAEVEAAAERARIAQAQQKEERDARYAARKAKARIKR